MARPVDYSKLVSACAMAIGASTILTLPTGLALGEESIDQVIRRVNAMPQVSEINGTVPPGKPTLVHSSNEVLNLVREGLQIRVYRDIREAGTRAPIHVHPFGGWTCVVSGQAVLVLQGSQPIRTGVGDCVNMPPLVPMSNINPGPGPAVLLDSFVTPVNAPVWRIIEKGETGLGNEFATDHNTRFNR